MFTFLLVVQAIVAACLVTVILMQRSEGGGLGVGGSPAGFMSARGAADFLTRSTAVLAVVFVSLSIVLAVIASVRHAPGTIDTSLVKPAGSAPAGAPAGPPATTGGVDPLSGAAQSVGTPSASPPSDSAQGDNGAVPLAN
ncbi:MAG: preprotein translocase subunit SecG [Sphingobium sp.]